MIICTYTYFVVRLSAIKIILILNLFISVGELHVLALNWCHNETAINLDGQANMAMVFQCQSRLTMPKALVRSTLCYWQFS